VVSDQLRKKPRTLALCGSNSPKSERYSSRIPSAGRRRVRPRRLCSPCSSGRGRPDACRKEDGRTIQMRRWRLQSPSPRRSGRMRLAWYGHRAAMSAPRSAAQLPRTPVSLGRSFRPQPRGRGRRGAPSTITLNTNSPPGEGESSAALSPIQSASTRRRAGCSVPSPVGRGPG
jgi:hypothetical protein